MLLDHNQFVVRAKGQAAVVEEVVRDPGRRDGQLLGMAADATGLVGSLLGTKTIHVREADGNTLAFSVTRSGLLMKKDQVLDAAGKVVGRYQSKRFSLSGGFHVYGADGKHLAEIQGKMLKAEYKFVTPDRKGEMGSVSRTLGGMSGMAKSLLTGG